MSMTAADYQDLLDSGEWSPAVRYDFERLRANATKRAELFARIGEQARKDALTYKWQQETLRELRRLFGECFEVSAWERAKAHPACVAEERNRLYPKIRGMRKRLARARREASRGCSEQSGWLRNHEELIAAVERHASQTDSARSTPV